jgi:hypothetical protein
LLAFFHTSFNHMSGASKHERTFHMATFLFSFLSCVAQIVLSYLFCPQRALFLFLHFALFIKIIL